MVGRQELSFDYSPEAFGREIAYARTFGFLKDVQQMMDQGLPDDARMMLGMMGFKIVINVHGELVNLDMPAQELPGDEEW